MKNIIDTLDTRVPEFQESSFLGMLRDPFCNEKQVAVL